MVTQPKVKEDTVICLHNDHIESSTYIGTCKICGQQRYYDPEKQGEFKIIKRGRIDGKLTEITPPRRGKIQPAPEPDLEPASEIIEEVIPMAKTEPATVEQPPVPPRPKKRKLLWKYFEDNKDNMIADHQSMRLIDFLDRWHICSGTWQKLKEKWNVSSKLKNGRPRSRKQAPPPAEDKVKRGDSLPLFPPFDANWVSIVQIEWLKTYKELRLAGIVTNEELRSNTE